MLKTILEGHLLAWAKESEIRVLSLSGIPAAPNAVNISSRVACRSDTAPKPQTGRVLPKAHDVYLVER